jgi:DNA-binding CsgD family transcriptional regulator
MRAFAELFDPWSVAIAAMAGAAVAPFAPWPVAGAVVVAVIAIRAVAGLAWPAPVPQTPAVWAGDPMTGPGGRLTPTEIKYTALAAQGLKNREIAEKLVVSERTVDNTLQHVRDKLDLRNRAEMTRWWFEVYMKREKPPQQ